MNIAESKINAFDSIAPYYDMLSRIVFGRSIRRSQMYQIQFIPRDANILILGGGTGWLLERLLQERPACHVSFLDSSQKMIEIARNRSAGATVTFIHGGIAHIPANSTFDVIIANFFFDQFVSRDMRVILKQIRRVMSRDGVLMIADFVDDKLWQKALLHVMYRFFSFFGAVVVSRLPPWEVLVREQRFFLQWTARFYGGFIRSNIYRHSRHR